MPAPDVLRETDHALSEAGNSIAFRGDISLDDPRAVTRAESFTSRDPLNGRLAPLHENH